MSTPPKSVRVDPVSTTTHHLELLFQETNARLSRATGFIYLRGGVHYMITNWHNVSGRHIETRECLSKTLAVPDAWAATLRMKQEPTNRERLEVRLYIDAEMKIPAWLEHPTHGSKVDVVAIPIEQRWAERYLLRPINAIEFDDLEADVGDDVFVVGYPFDETTVLHLPIWKRASIASEPRVGIEGLPKLLIDTATRQGLSGSPVIVQRVGVHGLGANGMPVDSTVIGQVRSFLGVYSGRIGADEVKAQLGIVWRATVLDEIIDAGVRGLVPH